MADENDIFFIDSSGSDDEQLDRMSGTSDDAKSPPFPRAGPSPTMEDVLFGLAPSKRPFSPASSPPPPLTSSSPLVQAHCASAGAAGCEVDSTHMDGSAAIPSSSPQEIGFPAVTGSARQHTGTPAAFPYAGGSPCAMPVKQYTPPPRTLAELRAMTSADVRDELERFFVRKDALNKRFKAAERELLARDGGKEKKRDEGETNPEAGEQQPLQQVMSSASVAASSAVGPSSLPSSSLTAAETLARDRCRRLVNVSNWDNAVEGYSQWDVLLPSALLPDLPAPPSSTAASASAPATANRRTLRPHQIEGIRFLWSVLAEGPVGQVPAVGCILAHTMGLGKTGQVVVFLHLFMAAFQRRAEAANGSTGSSNNSSTFSKTKTLLPRVLIVIPKSTQSGWKREFHTWSLCFPEAHRIRPLSVEEGLRAQQRVDIFRHWRRDGGVLLIGYEALVRLMQLVEADSVLTSQHRDRDGDPFYPTSADPEEERQQQQQQRQQRREKLREHRTDEGGKAYGGDADPFTELVVCDEAHRLKSVHLHVVQALRGLHPLRRMLLTGTPLQNHLHEYWAMMDFCVHKYFSRRRFREYFIQPIESSANTRASEREVDLARKKTFTLINEVRHFVQRVDSTPLRNELPPLHEYVVVVPPSQLQKELYLRFIQIVQHDGSQKLQFLPAVSYSGKISAHPQLLFQMRDQLAEASANRSNNNDGTSNNNNTARGRSGHPASGKKRVSDYWALEKQNRQANARQQTLAAQSLGPPPAKRTRSSNEDGDAVDGGRRGNRSGDSKAHDSSSNGEDEEEDADDAVIISDSESSSDSSGNRSEAAKAGEEEAFTRVTQQSFSHLCPAPLTYEELCIPPSPTYVPRLEEGAKLYVAMKLIAAAMATQEKVLFFSLSTQLLTFFEFMIAKVNREWCRPSADGAAAEREDGSLPRLPRPIRYCRLDGSHTAAQRAAMLDEFDRAEGPDLFLLSMKAGGVGVTITAATRVILVDTSFNPADDQQAIGRAYRYGQTRPVFVYRLMCYPTLEYSIFVQKLAKEWLFKTVVEESSVKRDGLSGMHLTELFSLLTRAAKTLQRPPAPTRAQTQTTREVLHDDPMLQIVQGDLLYAQRYEMFLEQDNDDQYGLAEEEFYKDYCRNRLFDLADDDDAERRRAAELLLRRQQRMDEAAQLQSQSKTLTSMVDDLIRSRADTDPHLARLLSAMGLRVDPSSGQVQTTTTMPWSRLASAAPAFAAAPPLEQSEDRFAPAPIVMLGGASANPMAAVRPFSPHTVMAPPNEGENAASRSPHRHDSHQTAVLLLDSDEEEGGAPEEKVPAPPTAISQENVQPLRSGARSDAADQLAASLARQPYARYRPGGSPSRAVEIDSDASQ